MSYQSPPKVWLHWLEFMSSSTSMTFSTITATAGKPAVVEFSWRAPHLCFVCIIKETRSKLMERYWYKLGGNGEQWAIYSRFLSLFHHSAGYRQGLSLSFTSFLSRCPRLRPLWECIGQKKLRQDFNLLQKHTTWIKSNSWPWNTLLDPLLKSPHNITIINNNGADNDYLFTMS